MKVCAINFATKQNDSMGRRS